MGDEERWRISVGWGGRKACKKWNVLSLRGPASRMQSHESRQDLPQGRLIDLSMMVKKLSRKAPSDLEWLWQFNTDWNGIAIMRGLLDSWAMAIEARADPIVLAAALLWGKAWQGLTMQV